MPTDPLLIIHKVCRSNGLPHNAISSIFLKFHNNHTTKLSHHDSTIVEIYSYAFIQVYFKQKKSGYKGNKSVLAKAVEEVKKYLGNTSDGEDVEIDDDYNLYCENVCNLYRMK